MSPSLLPLSGKGAGSVQPCHFTNEEIQAQDGERVASVLVAELGRI